MPKPTKTPTVLPVERIVLKRDLGRVKLDQKKIVEYAEFFDKLPPVIVYLIDDEYVLVDGFHRVAAAEQSNREELPVEVVTGKELRDAYWDSATINHDHGIPLDGPSKKRLILNRLSFFPERANDWIADELNVDNEFVKTCRRELEEQGLIEFQPRLEQRDGRSYPQEQGVQQDEIRRLKEADPELSDREIGRQVGVDGKTVRKVLTTASEEEVAAAYGEEGAQSSQIIADARADVMWRSRAEVQKANLFEDAPDWDEDALNGQLVEGDCIKHMEQLLKDGHAETVDFICTDPPYGIGRGEYDEFPDDETFAQFTRGWLELALRLLKPTGHIAVFWGGPWGPGFDHTAILPFLIQELSKSRGQGLWLQNMLIWQHNDTASLYWPEDVLRPTYDIIYVYAGPEATAGAGHILNYAAFPYEIEGAPARGAIWKAAAFTQRLHRAQKPLVVVKGLVELMTRPGDLVLDPFAGSGTLAVACHQTDRVWIAIENNPDYCKIARARIMLEGVKGGKIRG